MIANTSQEGAFLARGPEMAGRAGEPIELMLALPCEQVRTLEEAAHDRGLTVGQMIRRLISDFTSRHQVAEYWY
jgi:hypothetical protein